MPQIKEYFADAKITPTDRGTTAFEQAGRRIGGFAEQIARGDEKLGVDMGKLWNTAKFNLDLLHAETRGGGGGSAGRGNAHDALDFGRPFGSGATLGAAGQNESNPSGEGRSYNDVAGSYNARGARAVGEAAASLPALVTKIINGQGLTDQQYQQMGMTPRGASALFNARNQGGMTGLYGNDKGAIKPNPEPTDEEASRAGFMVDKQDEFGKFVPEYPPNASQWTGPLSNVKGTDANGNIVYRYDPNTGQPTDQGQQSSSQGVVSGAIEAATAVAASAAGLPPSLSPQTAPPTGAALGAQIYNSIVNAFSGGNSGSSSSGGESSEETNPYL